MGNFSVVGDRCRQRTQSLEQIMELCSTCGTHRLIILPPYLPLDNILQLSKYTSKPYVFQSGATPMMSSLSRDGITSSVRSVSRTRTRCKSYFLSIRVVTLTSGISALRGQNEAGSKNVNTIREAGVVLLRYVILHTVRTIVVQTSLAGRGGRSAERVCYCLSIPRENHTSVVK